MLKRAASKCETSLLSNFQTPALIDYARGASPSMRERRINRSHDASWIGSVASSQELYMSTTEYISSRQYILDVVSMTPDYDCAQA
jgi:hypothetical protein